MPAVRSLIIYLGRSPAAKHATPAANLMLDDDGVLCRRFHEALLRSQSASGTFKSKVAIPEMLAVDVHWVWAGDTGGVALWRRGGRTGAASVLLNGIEIAGEHEAVAAIFDRQRLAVPDHVWGTIAREPKPLMATLFYDLHSFTDPVIASAAPALANAFFTLFGTNG